MAVDGWAATFGTVRRGLGGLWARPVPSSLYRMWQPTRQRPVYQSLLLFDGPLLCGFNVVIKSLKFFDEFLIFKFGQLIGITSVVLCTPVLL